VFRPAYGKKGSASKRGGGGNNLFRVHPSLLVETISLTWTNPRLHSQLPCVTQVPFSRSAGATSALGSPTRRDCYTNKGLRTDGDRQGQVTISLPTPLLGT
jgi:hypothetical protein